MQRPELRRTASAAALGGGVRVAGHGAAVGALGLSRNSVLGGPTTTVARSSALRRAGSLLSKEGLPSTPPNTSGGLLPIGTPSSGSTASPSKGADFGASTPTSLVGTTPSSSPTAAAAAPNATGESLEDPAVCGLTPASLKHLRRVNQKLEDERGKLQVKEQQERVTALEEEAERAIEREDALKEDLLKAHENTEREFERAENLDKLNAKLEESLAVKENEIARLKTALEEQCQLTHDVCEAAERRANANRRDHELEEQSRRLQREKAQLEIMLKAQAQQIEETLRQQADVLEKRYASEIEQLREALAVSTAASKKAADMHNGLRSAKLSDAINQKIELHISVPRVTLTYNNAPPLLFSVAAGLEDVRIVEFLNREVFPFFEPLWVRMDNIDQAPDGSSKKNYSVRMLERLTEAVKSFIGKSQKAEANPGQGADGLVVVDRGPGAAQARPAPAGQGSGDGSGGVKALGEEDRERLLAMLRAGDDRGLDAKLVELLKATS
eukprot:TRINITY_DN10301_c0_g3_i6.p1 TRINITY_DN10301_c0_g3~~TRINITY_DN10301_c0_g3_i6.p1  ORF type:complete len:499 (-),score=151.08 TRINITY_DN10301_c0_g3_i6:167-1663(-)